MGGPPNTTKTGVFFMQSPIRNLKKLLETYQELLVTNQSTIKLPQVNGRLKVWQTNPGLQKVSSKLAGTIR
jgi:hypothetical protein